MTTPTIIGIGIVLFGIVLAAIRLLFGMPKTTTEAINTQLHWISIILLMILFEILGGLIILMAKLDTIAQLFLIQ